jgi:hypothetical protein
MPGLGCCGGVGEDFRFREVRNITSTSNIGRVVVEVRRPPEGPLSQLCRPEAAGQESTQVGLQLREGLSLDAVIRHCQMTAPMSDFCALSVQKRIFNIHAKVANGVLDLGVSKKDLHSAEVAGGFVDH